MPYSPRARQMVGRVVSNKMQKTVVVSIESVHRHPLYKHIIRTTKRYKAHDENNECQEGDTVRIIESRPLSKDKRWRVIDILRHDASATAPTVNEPVATGAESTASGGPASAGTSGTGEA